MTNMAGAKKWILVLVLSGFIINAKAQQQEFSYTQFMDNLAPINPAYSLIDKSGSINALIRKQFVGIDGAPNTFIFNTSFPLESINASTGLLISNDQFGVEQNTEINAFFAKAVQVGDSEYLSVSLSAGIKKYVADYSTLDPNDPQFRNDVRETKPNLGFGILLYTDTYYVGVSVPELTVTGLGTASVQDNSNFRNHYYLAGAILENLDEDFKFKPAALFSYVKGTSLIANLSGTLYVKEVLGIGLSYRTTKSAAGLFSINTSSFRLGYSYQFNTASNNLGGFNSTTHEVSLTYRFGKVTNPKLL